MKYPTALLTIALSVCSLTASPLPTSVKNKGTIDFQGSVQLGRLHHQDTNWKLVTSDTLPQGRPASLAASSDTGDFVAIASDYIGNTYSSYFLDHDNLYEGWTKQATFTGYDLAQIGYSNGYFVITGKDAQNNDEQALIFSNDNGQSWSSAKFTGIGSDSFVNVGSDHASFINVGSDHASFINVGSDHASFINVGSDPVDAAHFISIGSDGEKHSFNVGTSSFDHLHQNKIHRFATFSNNGDIYIAIGSDGSTYEAPVVKK